MKKILLVIAVLVAFGISKADNFKAPTKTRQSIAFTDTTTNHTYEIDEIKYPIFTTKNGAFYIWKTSKKTGKKYKYYLPKDIQVQLGRKYDK